MLIYSGQVQSIQCHRPQKQINDLQENLKILTESQPTKYDNMKTIHDDILKSINFELQKQATFMSLLFPMIFLKLKNHSMKWTV